MKIIILAALLIFAGPANSSTFAECNSTASQVNAVSPTRINEFMTIESVVCVPAVRKPIFTYVIRWDLSKAQLDAVRSRAERAPVINRLCTTPGMQNLLRAFDMRYDYYDNAGVYVTSDLYRIEDCL